MDENYERIGISVNKELLAKAKARAQDLAGPYAKSNFSEYVSRLMACDVEFQMLPKATGLSSELVSGLEGDAEQAVSAASELRDRLKTKSSQKRATGVPNVQKPWPKTACQKA